MGVRNNLSINEKIDKILDILMHLVNGMSTSKSGQDFLRESIEELRTENRFDEYD